MQHHATHKFLNERLDLAAPSWMLRAVLAGLALWAVAAPLLGIYDTWGLSINLVIGSVTLFAVSVFRRERKQNAILPRLTLQEFIDTDKATRSISLHDLTDEQIEHLRAELRSLNAT